MTYWRMQLHPDDSGNAVRHSVDSLSSGFIGLDFATPVGDMKELKQSDLPRNQRDYWAFAHEMKVGDWVLIMCHNFPFALARIRGDYNYIRNSEYVGLDSKLKMWFRHFRSVDEVSYYGDFKTNARDWESIIMPNTISPIRGTDTQSYRLVEEWLERRASAAVR